MRRSTHVEHEVVYAEVGASASPDLMRFPPADSTPYVEQLQLGSGSERFLTASSLLMTWGAQRGAGLEVRDITPGDGGHYAGIVFDDNGTPQPAAAREDYFGPDGEPYLTAGTRVRVVSRDRKPPERLMRVVYVIDEPQRTGFAWGSADDSGPVGEEVFSVEHREDDTVWAQLQGFMRIPASGLLGIRGKAAMKQSLSESRMQLEALLPGRAQTDAPPDETVT